MEKKTIGRFIAALRKANGLTQRELAEKLCISDKAVSRWERDETYPDLTLIPVIAEIFGVTSDELLRGERAPAEPSPAQEERALVKTEKQIEHMLRRQTVDFRIQSLAAVGMALTGVLAAAICNYAFLRAVLGFLIACGFYLAAAICEAIFLVLAFSALDGEWEGEAVERSKKDYVRWGCRVFVLIAALVGGTLPLLVFPYFTPDYATSVGLTGFTWPVCGAVCGAVAWAIAAAVAGAVRARLDSTVPAEIQRQKKRLMKKCAAVTAGILAVTVIVQMLLYANYETYAPGRSFDNYKDFVDFMETRTEPEYIYGQAPPDTVVAPIDGSAASEDFPLQSLTNSAGEILCQFHWNNRRVVHLQYDSSDTLLPITVRTQADQQRAYAIRSAVNLALCALDAAEVALGTAVYFLLRRKIQ